MKCLTDFSGLEEDILSDDPEQEKELVCIWDKQQKKEEESDSPKQSST